jgi:hypothetical protein
MNSLWLVVPILLAQLLLYIGIPTLVLMLVLRHHRRKLAELWLSRGQSGGVPPAAPLPARPKPWARAWTLLGYPRR